jgi:molybdate transport system regulatory protein
MASLFIRIDLSPSIAIGPGKIRLLELIEETGSISAAGRAMKMSYRRAWVLLDEMNHMFHQPVATTALGGRSGGGATLTPFGKRVVRGYRKMGKDAHSAVASYLSMVRFATTAPRRTSASRQRQAKQP